MGRMDQDRDRSREAALLFTELADRNAAGEISDEEARRLAERDVAPLMRQPPGHCSPHQNA